jgi:crotonobetainyl-CoA:carnitine CoA-transferase CaiB-like acyl-CoA transferase
MLLGDMGADIIKVEDPRQGDDGRTWAPFVNTWSAYFLGVNRNKKSIAVDLKTGPGAQVLRRLLARADVLVENFRPGSLAKLGFGFERVHELNPALVYCSVSGYGDSGPKRGLPGYDAVIQAESGLMSITGFREGDPLRSAVPFADYTAGLYAYAGVLLALRDRDRTGIGQHVDISLFDSLLSTFITQVGILQATGVSPGRLGNDHALLAPYEVFRANDGMIMVAVSNERLWKQLCVAVEATALLDDPRFCTNTQRTHHRMELKRALERVFAPFAVDDLITRLQGASVPCGKVRTIAEALDDPQVAERHMLLSFEEPEVEGFKVLGNPVKLSRTPASTHPGRPPRLGEHTESILRELGYDDGEIADIVRSHAEMV